MAFNKDDSVKVLQEGPYKDLTGTVLEVIDTGAGIESDPERPREAVKKYIVNVTDIKIIFGETELELVS